MASTRSKKTNPPPAEALSVPAISPPGTTGRFLVLFKEGTREAASKALSNAAGLRVTSSTEMGDAAFDEASGDGLMFDEIGVAVVDSAPDQVHRLGIAAADNTNEILAIEPERMMYAIAAMPSSDYFVGYRDGVSALVDRAIGAAGPAGLGVAAAGVNPFSEVAATWGLQITNALASHSSGKGIRVAVLDTGFDLNHPDFVGRSVTTRSFVAGELVQDGHGHGTHCIGTACGPRVPGNLPRYGIAFEAEIFAGKVLSNAGSGADGGILNGINWAIANKCVVISMSLGAPTQPGEVFSPAYEAVARRALQRGSLIVAAAGNESHRPFQTAPVGRPANCPSILAVAALDPNRAIANFSCGQINGNGGEVNIAAPGVAVRSSWPLPVRYNTISGTSMATPHVAGLAALHAQANPNARGRALWNIVTASVTPLVLPAADVGSGLAMAP